MGHYHMTRVHVVHTVPPRAQQHAKALCTSFPGKKSHCMAELHVSSTWDDRQGGHEGVSKDQVTAHVTHKTLQSPGSRGEGGGEGERKAPSQRQRCTSLVFAHEYGPRRNKIQKRARNLRTPTTPPPPASPPRA